MRSINSGLLPKTLLKFASKKNASIDLTAIKPGVDHIKINHNRNESTSIRLILIDVYIKKKLPTLLIFSSGFDF